MIDFSVRISIFLVAFSSLMAWQWFAPRGILLQWRQRWRHNLILLMLGALCVRLIQPVLLSVVALSNQGEGWLTHLGLPFWALVLISILLLDCLIYWQHRLFHRVPLLWRLHRVHHSDPELDVSSAIRFHPVEIVMSLCIKATAVWLFGIPVEAVLIFDVLLNASAMFNHTNVRLSPRLEKWVKVLVVTPDMHRIHHSRISEEANSNYGFFLSIWDAFFGSKRPEAMHGDAGLNIGMPGTKAYQPNTMGDLLLMPLKNFKKSRKSE